MGLLERFLDRIEFSSYEDFKQNYRVNVPEGFNFGYDIIDEWAKLDDNKPALVWCDGSGAEKTLFIWRYYAHEQQSGKCNSLFGHKQGR